MAGDILAHPWNTAGPMELDYTDRAGARWTVIDYRNADVGGKRKRVPISNWRADGRAFIPAGREAQVRLHEFGLTAYRWADAKTLERQLEVARAVGSGTPADAWGHSASP